MQDMRRFLISLIIFTLLIFQFHLIIHCSPYIRIESVIPGIDKQPVNATLMDAVPIVSSVSSLVGINDGVDSEATSNTNEGDFIPSDKNVIGELIPFSPLDGCNILQESIFTTTDNSSKVEFSPSDPNSHIVVLMDMNGNCSIDRKLFFAQRTSLVVGVILIGPILPSDQEAILGGLKTRLSVFSVSTKIGDTLLSLTTWYRQHRIHPIPPGGLPMLNDSSESSSLGVNSISNNLNSSVTNSTSKVDDDAWIRATLVSETEIVNNLGVLEFALLIVVVLLAISFIASIVLHFYFFHIRGQQQVGNTDPGSSLQQLVLPDSYLRYLPIRIYGELLSESPDLKKRASRANELVKQSDCTSIDMNNEIITSPIMSNSSNVHSTNESDTEISERKQNPINQRRSPSQSPSENISSGATSAGVVTSPTPSVHSTSSWIISAIRNSIVYFSLRKSITPPSYNDMCPVCIEDFTIKSKVRELPCQHIFHPECIDSWLTTRASSCPMCKFDCYESIKRVLDYKDPNDMNIRENRSISLFARVKKVITTWCSKLAFLFSRNDQRDVRNRPPVVTLA